jgi:formate hydrogenlyase transcriptional activator
VHHHISHGDSVPGSTPEFFPNTMSTEPLSSSPSSTRRYEAVLDISKALTAYRDPEELASILADKLGEFLSFNHLDVVTFKENSPEVECLAWGKGSLPVSSLSAEELRAWQLFDTEEPLHIADWNSDERFPNVKRLAATQGVDIGSVVRVPLTAPHRRLGTLGLAAPWGTTYSAEDISFLQMIARVVAFVIDDSLNLGCAQAAQAELQRQSDRLQLLVNLTNRITSNLELREVLRAVSSNIREVMHCDAVFVSLVDSSSGTPRLYVLDFPQSKGFIEEEKVYTISGAGRRVLETLKPLVVDVSDPAAVPPEIYDKVVAEGLKSACLIPLVNRGRVLGGLVIARTTETSFAPEDVQFLTQAAGQIAIAIENALTFKEVSELRDKLAQEKLYLEEEIRSEMNFDQIIGNSPALKHVLELVETVAPNDSTVLLLGETGTGKELISRAIHDRSRRKDRTFVKLNCAAIPTGLLESELFGHEKGAFTGAVAQKMGRLELADQGTLFLDEVGDIPIEIQPKLLRALQEREFERLGSTRTRSVNVRLVAATNRDLEKMITNREFRSDLFYRLNVFPIRIPPLRDRRDDVPLLVRYFVQKFARQMQKNIETIPSAVMKELTACDWPGNIRELENFIERAVILTRGKSLEAPVGELHEADTEQPGRAATPTPQDDIARIVKETVKALNADKNSLADEYSGQQREKIVRALTESKGRVGGPKGAAARLGINRTTLLSRMKRFGIDRRQFAA